MNTHMIVGSLMLAIENNPFRIIGVLANAKEKDIHRQKVKISKYISVGKNIDCEYDFDFFKSIQRTEKTVNDAFSSVNKRQEKLDHSLFWFVNSNPIDEIALNSLSDSNKEKAMFTWSKPVEGREVTKKFISCLNNLSTLQLCSEIDSVIVSGITNKLKLIQSSDFQAYVAMVTDESFIVDSHKQSKKIINLIVKQLLVINKTEIGVVKIFSHCDKWVQEFVANQFCESIIFETESAIESTKKKRVRDGDQAYSYALALKENVYDKVWKVSSILGENHIRLKTISDAVAQEIMLCGVVYFNTWHEIRNVYDHSLELLDYAKSFAKNQKTKKEVQKNIDEIKKQKEQYQIGKYYDDIYKELDDFSNRFASVENAVALINVCKPKLNAFKADAASSEGYISLSSTVAMAALSMIIQKVNTLEKSSSSLDIVSITLISAFNAMNTLSNLDMDIDSRDNFNINYKTIKELHSQVSAMQAEQWNKQDGCYIATLAYGDYNHPQVIHLRQFRDECLAKYHLGRIFIKYYYRYSPIMVRKLRHSRMVNEFVKTCLDAFIKKLGK